MTRRATQGCPICGKPRVAAFEPFCSERCKAVDLHRWLSGSYVVPGLPADEADTDGDPGAAPLRPERDERPVLNETGARRAKIRKAPR